MASPRCLREPRRSRRRVGHETGEKAWTIPDPSAYALRPGRPGALPAFGSSYGGVCGRCVAAASGDTLRPSAHRPHFMHNLFDWFERLRDLDTLVQAAGYIGLIAIIFVET